MICCHYTHSFKVKKSNNLWKINQQNKDVVCSNQQIYLLESRRDEKQGNKQAKSEVLRTKVNSETSSFPKLSERASLHCHILHESLAHHWVMG